MINLNNEKNKSAVILSPERSEWVSRSHVTSVELVVNDGTITQPRFCLKRSLRGFRYAQPLKMTSLALILSFNLSTVWAACGTTVTGESSVGTNASGNKCGVCGTVGHESDCRWEIKDGVLTISRAAGVENSVTMADYSTMNSGVTSDYSYSWSSNAPWARSNITSVVVENGISNIGNRAFNGDTKITSLTLSDSVTSIGDSAFYYASSLTNVDMPNVETINGYAFYNTDIISVDMPKVKIIGDAAFGWSDKLVDVYIPEATSISFGAFEGTAITGIDAPNLEDLNLQGIDGKYFRIPDNTVVREGSGLMEATSYLSENCAHENGYYVCGTCNGYPVSGRGCVTADTCEISSHYKWDSSTNSCNRIQTAANGVDPSSCYANGQVHYNNACVDEYPFAKKHWTPAEAAQYLKDTDNEIILTFKINR